MISEPFMRSVLAHLPGWSMLDRGSFTSGWHVVYQGRYQDYDAYLDVDNEWIYLQCTMLPTPARRECRPALYDYLLRLNDRMYSAKFTLFRTRINDADVDNIALVVECPAESFDATQFRLMAEAVSTYAQEYDMEIRTIAFEIALLSYLTESYSS